MIGLLSLWVAFLVAGCAPAGFVTTPVDYNAEPITLATLIPTAAPFVTATPTPDFSGSLPATNTPIPTGEPPPTSMLATLRPTEVPFWIEQPTETSVPTLDPRVTPTFEPQDPDYAGRTIVELTQRSYSGGDLELERVLLRKRNFARYLFRYNSDGLTVYGFVNVPYAENLEDNPVAVDGRLPVAFVLHGYVPLSEFTTQAYTTRYADALADAGYIVFHPNYRSHAPSESSAGYNTFRVDYAIDVLNLMTMLQDEQLSLPAEMELAMSGPVYMMGHSMGGGIVQRVMSVRPEWVRAAVLYGSMSGDERLNYERIQSWAGERTWQKEVFAPDQVLNHVSPAAFLHLWQAPVSIHHGQRDSIVPVEWSNNLCAQLQASGKTVECIIYSGASHEFVGTTDKTFISHMIEFFYTH